MLRLASLMFLMLCALAAAYTSRSSLRSHGRFRTCLESDNRRLSEKIEEAGGFKEWVADELTKDRTESRADSASKATSGLPDLELSPAAKERKRKADELNEMVTRGVRASGAFLVITTFALLLLAKQYGLTDQ